MKFTSYTFTFKGGKITTSALNYKEAKILAQAEAIKRGWDYAVVENPCIKCRLNYDGRCGGCDKGREYKRIMEESK